jgi:glycosyltransferase involved in cell wall biosynthesis
MNLHALVVSVDYAPELARSIDRWLTGLASLVVVTCARDEATIALARARGARLHVTEAFYEDGAYFNKWRALQQARALLPAGDWHAFIDADVVPPDEWQTQLEAAEPTVGTLHGARRVDEHGALIHDAELAGFFHLFHSSDPRAAHPLERDWLHAGNGDSAFLRRWPRRLQRLLPLTLVHLGEPRRNWCGKGNDAALEEILARRRARQSWKTETVRHSRR